MKTARTVILCPVRRFEITAVAAVRLDPQWISDRIHPWPLHLECSDGSGKGFGLQYAYAPAKPARTCPTGALIRVWWSQKWFHAMQRTVMRLHRCRAHTTASGQRLMLAGVWLCAHKAGFCGCIQDVVMRGGWGI
jgi:hypothetical protein